jgi:hypothetical protein
MKRYAGACVLLAGLGGCMTPKPQPDASANNFGRVGYAKEAGNLQGAWGQPVPIGYDGKAALNVSKTSPSGIVQTSYTAADSGVVQTGGILNKDCAGCATCGQGKGPRIIPPPMPSHGGIYPVPPQGPPGAVAAVGAITGGMPAPYGNGRTEVRFAEPAGMKVSWYAPGPTGPGFSEKVEAPGRYNFLQGAVYRLKLSGIPTRPGLDLYPTLEVLPASVKTATYIAHSAVPVSFTEEDFDQVLAGNFVVKVIYLPDPQFQDLAVAAPGEISSTKLEPGVDPIVEAQRRGSILLVVRVGNIDLEAPNTPAMDAPSPYAAPQPVMPRGPVMPGVPSMVPGMVPPGATAGPAPVMPGTMMPGTSLPAPPAPKPSIPVVTPTPVSSAPTVVPPSTAPSSLPSLLPSAPSVTPAPRSLPGLSGYNSSSIGSGNGSGVVVPPPPPPMPSPPSTVGLK